MRTPVPGNCRPCHSESIDAGLKRLSAMPMHERGFRTMTEIAVECGCSAQTILNIQRQALAKVRSAIRGLTPGEDAAFCKKYRDDIAA